MKIYKIAAILVAVFALAGCKPTAKSQGQYPLTFTEARVRLERADVIGFRNARQCGLLIHFSPYRPDTHSVAWVVMSSDREVASFTVSLSSIETGRVATTIVVPKGNDGGEAYDGKQNYTHPALMQPLRPAIQELIDSAMQQRPYDPNRIPDRLLNTGPPKTVQNCSIGQQLLQRGIPMEFDDPEGVPHDVALKLKQAGNNTRDEGQPHDRNVCTHRSFSNPFPDDRCHVRPRRLQ